MTPATRNILLILQVHLVRARSVPCLSNAWTWKLIEYSDTVITNKQSFTWHTLFKISPDMNVTNNTSTFTDSCVHLHFQKIDVLTFPYMARSIQPDSVRDAQTIHLSSQAIPARIPFANGIFLGNFQDGVSSETNFLKCSLEQLNH